MATEAERLVAMRTSSTHVGSGTIMSPTTRTTNAASATSAAANCDREGRSGPAEPRDAKARFTARTLSQRGRGGDEQAGREPSAAATLGGGRAGALVVGQFEIRGDRRRRRRQDPVPLGSRRRNRTLVHIPAP